jgi:hypothetical protein
VVFQVQAIVSPREYLAIPGDIFYHNRVEGAATVSGGCQLSILQCTGQSPKQRII